jgi:hypothetical protein
MAAFAGERWMPNLGWPSPKSSRLRSLSNFVGVPPEVTDTPARFRKSRPETGKRMPNYRYHRDYPFLLRNERLPSGTHGRNSIVWNLPSRRGWGRSGLVDLWAPASAEGCLRFRPNKEIT